MAERAPPYGESASNSFHTVHLKEKNKAQQRKKAKLRIYTSLTGEIIYVWKRIW